MYTYKFRMCVFVRANFKSRMLSINNMIPHLVKLLRTTTYRVLMNYACIIHTLLKNMLGVEGILKKLPTEIVL